MVFDLTCGPAGSRVASDSCYVVVEHCNIIKMSKLRPCAFNPASKISITFAACYSALLFLSRHPESFNASGTGALDVAKVGKFSGLYSTEGRPRELIDWT